MGGLFLYAFHNTSNRLVYSCAGWGRKMQFSLLYLVAVRLYESVTVSIYQYKHCPNLHKQSRFVTFVGSCYLGA